MTGFRNTQLVRVISSLEHLNILLMISGLPQHLLKAVGTKNTINGRIVLVL